MSRNLLSNVIHFVLQVSGQVNWSGKGKNNQRKESGYVSTLWTWELSLSLSVMVIFICGKCVVSRYHFVTMEWVLTLHGFIHSRVFKQGLTILLTNESVLPYSRLLSLSLSCCALPTHNPAPPTRTVVVIRIEKDDVIVSNNRPLTYLHTR